MSENTERLDAIQSRVDAATPGPWELFSFGASDVAFLLDMARKQQAALDALSQWAGRAKTGYYDEAQDDVVQIIRIALDETP